MTWSTNTFGISSVLLDLVGWFVPEEKCLNTTTKGRRFILHPNEHFAFHAKLLCNPREKTVLNVKTKLVPSKYQKVRAEKAITLTPKDKKQQ